MISGKIAVIEGNITLLQVDAVINAANPSLLGGSGVNGRLSERLVQVYSKNEEGQG